MSFRLACLAMISAIVVAASGADPATAQGNAPKRLQLPLATDRLDQSLFNEAVLHYSNAVRRQHGRPPLAADPALAKVAARHASNMARLKTHSHVLPVRGERELTQRLKRQSVSFRLAAENIAMDKVYRLLGRPISMKSSGCNFTYGDTRAPVPRHTYASLAEQVVNRWLASPGHRKSLLSTKFRRLGSGVGIDRGGVACGDLYLVQNFAD